MIPTVIRQALDPECDVIAVGDTRPTRDFSYVGDTVTAFAVIGAADRVNFGRPYNAGSGMAVSVGEMIEHVRAITGVNKPVVNEVARMRPSGSEVMALFADSCRLTGATGWTSSVDFETGLVRTIEWWRGQLAMHGVRQAKHYLT